MVHHIHHLLTERIVTGRACLIDRKEGGRRLGRKDALHSARGREVSRHLQQGRLRGSPRGAIECARSARIQEGMANQKRGIGQLVKEWDDKCSMKKDAPRLNGHGDESNQIISTSLDSG